MVMKISLPKYKDSIFIDILSRMDVNHELDLPEGCFWIGSCSGGKDEVEKFIALAKQGNIAEMEKKNYIGDDAVYAIAVRDRTCNGMVNIFVVITCFGINPQINILHNSRIKCEVDIVPRKATHQPLIYRPKWWHYLVDIISPGKGVDLALKIKK